MQDKNITKSTFFQLFQPIFSKNLQEKISVSGIDKYLKKLNTVQLIKVIIFAQLIQHKNLREISSVFNDSRFSKQIGVQSFSASQISRRLRALPTEILQLIFHEVISQAIKKIGFSKAKQELGNLRIIDSTTISLCLTHFPWAIFRKTKSGIKLHLSLRFINGITIPEKAVITPAKRHDRTQMDALINETTEQINVFDRGYIDYEKFDKYCQQSICFVSCLKDGATVEIIENRPIPSDSNVEKDVIVKLGKNHKKMKHKLRLIEVSDTQGNPLEIITNNFELTSQEIGDIYRYRWQIETFFKWLKQHCYIKHFYGLSQQAVENQIYIALITYSLLQLFKLEIDYKGQLLEILTLLKTCFSDFFEIFLKKLYQKKRKSKGRRKIDYEKIYKMTERQVMQGEMGQLYDSTYDPIIL